jgi:hypothetical protein
MEMTVAERITSKLNTDSFAPYVDQALHDDELHARARRAYSSGQDVYGTLRKEPDLVSALARLASDEKLQRDARATVIELHRAARRFGESRDRGMRRALRALVVASAVGVVVFAASRRVAQQS